MLTEKPNLETLRKAVELTNALVNKRKYNLLDFMYPMKGNLSRFKYPKHCEFFKAGKNHLIRAMLGANGSGKTMGGGTEFVYHLTGKYPDWWEGRKFNQPIKAWGCARENKQLREAMQEALFGDPSDLGTGLIPKDCLIGEDGKTIQTWAMSGTPGCIGNCRIKHYTNGVFDGYSQCHFKTYAQGWQEFQGANRDLIWLDEEPDDPKIHSECVARLRGRGEGTEGSLYYTFTPLLGYSTIYLSFLPNGEMPPGGISPDNPEKFVLVVTDRDVPHLTDKAKAAMLEEWKITDPNSIDARKSGIAAIGSGRIYPVDEKFIVIEPINIPDHWPRAFGLDFGWHATAVIWAAQDPTTKVIYLYSEYKQGKQAPYVHVQNIKSKGQWIPGAADPSGGGTNQKDGTRLINDYIEAGLKICPGYNDINAGIARQLNLLESGLLKVFSTCQAWIKEYRVYRYDINNPNKPADKQDDHLMDATKYLLSIFDQIALSKDDYEYEPDEFADFNRPERGRDELTGY